MCDGMCCLRLATTMRTPFDTWYRYACDHASSFISLTSPYFVSTSRIVRSGTSGGWLDILTSFIPIPATSICTIWQLAVIMPKFRVSFCSLQGRLHMLMVCEFYEDSSSRSINLYHAYVIFRQFHLLLHPLVYLICRVSWTSRVKHTKYSIRSVTHIMPLLRPWVALLYSVVTSLH